MAFNDTLWDLLDKVHLRDFFEEKNIPLIVFPIAILLVLVLIIFLLLPSGAGPETEPCGDGVCDLDNGEDILSCPEDCQPTQVTEGSTVTIEIVGGIKNQITVRLEDGSGNLIQTKSGTNEEFIITGVTDSIVRAVVSNPLNGEVATSAPESINNDETTITVILPNDFFSDEEPPKQEPTASVQILVKDKDTNSPVTAKVTVVIPNGASHSFVETKDIAGSGYFTLPTGEWYALIAEASGYKIYESRDIPFTLEVGVQRAITIQLEPTTFTQPSILTVCLENIELGTISGGVIISTLTGETLDQDSLSGGCATFELVKEQTISISTTNLPENCLDTNTELTLGSSQEQETINIICQSFGPGQIRVKVVNELGDTVTQDALVTAWYFDGTQIRGTGISYSLDLGSGDYTEFVEVDSTKEVYFIVANLEDYSVYTSDEYSVPAGENKSEILDLALAPQPEEDMSILGISFPEPVAVNTKLEVLFSNVLYGQTDVTDESDISIQFAGIDCVMDEKSATCVVPGEAAIHDLKISAVYGKHKHDEVKQVEVRLIGNPYYFNIQPHAMTDFSPPVDLIFDIEFNDTPLKSLDDNEVTIYYVSGGITAKEGLKLKGGDGIFSVTVDSPFPGDHKAELYLLKIKGSNIYEETFTHYFELEPSSVQLDAEMSMVPQITEPDKSVSVYLRIKENNKEIASLENVYVTIDNQRSSLFWDSELHTYSGTIKAPSRENIYPAIFEVEYQEVETGYLYVVDTSESRAADCEISECDNILEVRQCVYEHDNENLYSTSDVIDCIEEGLSILPGVSIIHCGSTSNKGDWNNNCEIDSSGTYSDVIVMREFLKVYTDPSERNEYQNCGDMDNDGDVDDDDLTCLTNVVSTKWYGDTTADLNSDGSCTKEMKGGFCLDINDGLPGDYDGSDTFDSDDVGIMNSIVTTANKGVTPPAELLAIADFNQDGRVNNDDLSCLNSIVATSGSIGSSCLNVYGFGCFDIKGDLDNDGILGDFDILFETWIVEGRLSDPGCGDLNEDGILDEEDLFCIQAMASGNSADAYEYCTTCQYKMTELGIYGDEICNDGYDNDCDGNVDLTPGRYNHCECNIATRCSDKWDNNGIPGVDDGDYSLCRYMSWESEEGYQWLDVEDVETLESDESCVLELNCHYWQCAEIHHVCSKGDGDPAWLLVPSTVHGDMGLDNWRNAFDEIAEGKYDDGVPEGNDYNISMDGTNNISGECGTYTYDCETYITYYGPYGAHLPCEGPSYEGLSTDTLCDDGWDNNCLSGDSECDENAPYCSSGW